MGPFRVRVQGLDPPFQISNLLFLLSQSSHRYSSKLLAKSQLLASINECARPVFIKQLCQRIMNSSSHSIFCLVRSILRPGYPIGSPQESIGLSLSFIRHVLSALDLLLKTYSQQRIMNLSSHSIFCLLLSDLNPGYPQRIPQKSIGCCLSFAKEVLSALDRFLQMQLMKQFNEAIQSHHPLSFSPSSNAWIPSRNCP